MTTDLIQLTESPAGQFSLSKATSAEVANKVINLVDEGFVDPLDTLIKLSWLQTTIETCIKAIRPHALTEAERYGQKSFRAFGCDIQIKETGVKYDYSDSEEWRQMDEQEKEMQMIRKQLEERLRFTGAAAKSSTTSVSITLPRE